MNTNILTKCIDELKKEKPDLSYLRGMLETLVEMVKLPDDLYLRADGKGNVKAVSIKAEIEKVATDEAQILDAQARMALKTIKAIGGEQTE